MVTSLQSVQLQSAQFLLKALKETEQQSQAETGNTRTALLQRYGIDTSSSSSLSQNTLSGLLDIASNTDEDDDTAVSTDVTTESFMTGLKAKLEELAQTAGNSQQAQSMLAALEAGTLVVTDPLNGIAVMARDVDDASGKDADGEPGTTIDKTGWSEFLKTHLARGDTGAFSRTSDGSYVDAVTGDSAYFGAIGSAYFYLSWPQSTVAT